MKNQICHLKHNTSVRTVRSAFDPQSHFPKSSESLKERTLAAAADRPRFSFISAERYFIKAAINAVPIIAPFNIIEVGELEGYNCGIKCGTYAIGEFCKRPCNGGHCQQQSLNGDTI